METKEKAVVTATAKVKHCSDCNHCSCHKARGVRVRMPDGKVAVFSGQVAKTLSALVGAGKNGVTSLEISSWALRLSAYIFILRHEHGLEITMHREPHATGWHGRYFLLSSVIILRDGDGEN